MLETIFGSAGILVNMLTYQQNEGKKLLLYKLISDVLWAVHYFLIGASAAGTIATINIFRELIFLHQNKRRKKIAWLYAFVVVGLISSLFTWKGPFSLLPAIGTVLSATSFGLNKPHLTRCLSLPISVMMLTYDMVFHSYMGIINEILTIGSTIIGLIRLPRR